MISQDSLLYGQCHLFAIALHDLTGFPLLAATANYGRRVLVHCWVRAPGDAVIDASGLTTTEYSLSRYPDGDQAEVAEISRAALMTLGEGRGWASKPSVAADLDAARQYVLRMFSVPWPGEQSANAQGKPVVSWWQAREGHPVVFSNVVYESEDERDLVVWDFEGVDVDEIAGREQPSHS